LKQLVLTASMKTPCRSYQVDWTNPLSTSRLPHLARLPLRWRPSSHGSINPGQDGQTSLQALTRAAVGHLYFESIHPFEDGNGRIGRALAEKSLAQNIGQPSLISLAFTIEKRRKAYYSELERHQRTLDITDWVIFFSETILDAQRATLERVDFFIQKAKFYDRFRDKLNERQEKVVARIFKEGTAGFKGGLSAENYISITDTSRATATRDLQQLVEIGALTRRGERRHTRYSLSLQK
jgi:Fic family protein